MKRTIALSLFASLTLNATALELDTIGIESTLITEVAQNAQTSADVAQALSDTVPSIDISRRSGIANDILIRGQKRDNITVEVDGTKVCGACPNRMDPPASHIVANQIESIEVIEGPYDVETFGTLSGGIKVKTKQPSKELKGSINVGFGAFNYKKFGASINGGNDRIRVAATVSTESSDQYKDGNGDTIADQIDNFVLTNPTTAGTAFQPRYHDMQAYSKKSAMMKAAITTVKNQELRLSVTANRSDDILYANSKMDAMYDDSNIYSVEYNADKLDKVYKNLNIQYYYSDVDHPMATKYRKSALNQKMNNTNHLATSMEGLKFKNTFDVMTYDLLIGVDGSKRTWDGRYYNTSDGGATHIIGGASKSIDDAVTKNMAFFAKLSKSYNALSFALGARLDDTRITNATLSANSYSSIGLNLLTSYKLNEENQFFFGLGQAYRVPDARELYFVGSKGNQVGTDHLKQTKNQEIDLGYEINSYFFRFKVKGFYSKLSDYIYYQKDLRKNNFKNIDAIVYGTELSGSIYATDDLTIDMSASYKRGKKDNALKGQTNTNLTDIAPLRGKIAANYEYANNSLASLEIVASDTWDNIDSDNGEQVLDSWTIVNAKVKHAINKKFDFTLGVNNLFNSTYALSNTGADLVLISSGGSNDIMLMNEPGRYIYTNLDFKF